MDRGTDVHITKVFVPRTILSLSAEFCYIKYTPSETTILLKV